MHVEVKVCRTFKHVIYKVVEHHNQGVSVLILLQRRPNTEKFLLDQVELMLSLQKIVDDKGRQSLLRILTDELLHHSLKFDH